jgi:hypothetical protein
MNFNVPRVVVFLNVGWIRQIPTPGAALTKLMTLSAIAALRTLNRRKKRAAMGTNIILL